MIKRDQGFTVIEVLAAALLLSVGILASLNVFNSSRRLTLVSERTTTLAQRAENELERVLSLPWSQVALTGTSSSWSTKPSDYTYVSSPTGGCPSNAGGAAPTYQPDHSGASSATEALVINGCTYTTTLNVNGTAQTQTLQPTAGTVAPVQTWSAPGPSGGTVSGDVYDFITWATDPTCQQTSTPYSKCSQADDYKRVTVVVTMNGISQPSLPALVSGLATPPNNGQPVNGSTGTSCQDGPTTVSCTNTPPCPSGGCDTPIPGFPPAPGGGDGSTQCTTSSTPGTLSSSLPTSSCYVPLPSSSSCASGPPSGVASSSWLTPAIPLGVTWNVTGTGTMTVYLESSSGTAVSTNLCVGMYVLPSGPVGNLFSQPIGTAFSVSATASAGAPTPMTFDYTMGSPVTPVLSSTGLAQIEFVLWTTAAAAPVDMYTGAQFASQITFMAQT